MLPESAETILNRIVSASQSQPYTSTGIITSTWRLLGGTFHLLIRDLKARTSRWIVADNPGLQPSLHLPQLLLQNRSIDTMPSKGLKPVFGGGPIGEGKDFPNTPMIEELYQLLKEGGCDTIDTARLYSNSEEWIGKTHGGDHFIIDSKTPGGAVVGGSDSAGILQHAKETVEKLGVKNVSD